VLDCAANFRATCGPEAQTARIATLQPSSEKKNSKRHQHLGPEPEEYCWVRVFFSFFIRIGCCDTGGKLYKFEQPSRFRTHAAPGSRSNRKFLPFPSFRVVVKPGFFLVRLCVRPSLVWLRQPSVPTFQPASFHYKWLVTLFCLYPCPFAHQNLIISNYHRVDEFFPRIPLIKNQNNPGRRSPPLKKPPPITMLLPVRYGAFLHFNPRTFKFEQYDHSADLLEAILGATSGSPRNCR